MWLADAVVPAKAVPVAEVPRKLDERVAGRSGGTGGIEEDDLIRHGAVGDATNEAAVEPPPVPPPLATATDTEVDARWPVSSSAVSTTLYVPIAVKACEAIKPVPVAPSPKFQLNDVSVCPGAAVDCSALNTMLWPACGDAGENTTRSKGAARPPTATGMVPEVDAPRLLVTVSVTLNVCCVPNVWVTERPLPPAVPSPKFHA